MNEQELLNSYLLNIVKFSVEIIQDIDVMDLNEEKVAEIGKIVSQLAKFKKDNYIEIPF